MDSSQLTLSFNTAVIGPWVCEKAGGKWKPDRGPSIGLMKRGELVAGVLYEDFNGANVICHIRGEPGWACRRFLGVIFYYPFKQLGATRITVPVCSSNTACRKLVEHMGFTLESTLAEATPLGDMLLYRMFESECKYLGGKYG